MKKKAATSGFNWKEFSFFLKYITPHKKIISLLLLLFLASAGISFLYPFITKYTVDFGILQKDLRFITLILLGQLLLTIGGASIDIIRSWVFLKMETLVGLSMLKDFLVKLSKLSIAIFDQRNIGDIQQRLYDNQRVQYLLTSQSVSLVVSLVNFLAFFTAVTVFNWRILIILIVFSIIEFIWIIRFMKKRAVIDNNRFEAMSASQDNLYEIITGMQDIKLNNHEDAIIGKWEDTQWKLFEVRQKNMKVEQAQMIGTSLIGQIETVFISFLTAYDVIEGRMSLGEMVSINFIVGQLKVSIQQFIFLNRTLQDAQLSIQRLNTINKQENEDKDTALPALDTSISSIELKNVSYSYTEGGPLTLNRLNISFSNGELTVIVGSSGSGKSTLVKLLAKYYAPTTGEICINGNINLNDLSSVYWRKNCGISMQDGYIFSDTVMQNITLGKVGDRLVDIDDLAAITNLNTFVNQLSQKWSTRIDKSVGLSGGQRQRILIARVLFRNPDVIILDEPTSALDGENEEKIIKNIKQKFACKIIIIITHRFSTTKFADQIIVLDNGQVVEKGIHNDLIEAKGKYYSLFKNDIC